MDTSNALVKIAEIVLKVKEFIDRVKYIVDKFCYKINKYLAELERIINKAIEKIKGFFDFSWELPELKLPHVSITGKFSINPPSVPKFGISWYSKGAIFKRPTVLGGMGIGDRHNGIGSNAEAILPINQLPKLLGLDKMQNSGVTLSIENFNNNTDRDIEYLANELAYFMKRKALV
jgi:hypothetical protein